MFRPPDTLTLAVASSTFADGVQALAAGQSDIDFGGVTAVDSSAVALLLAWRRAAAAQGKTLRFHHLPAGLLSLAALYGATGLLDATHAAPHPR